MSVIFGNWMAMFFYPQKYLAGWEKKKKKGSNLTNYIQREEAITCNVLILRLVSGTVELDVYITHNLI